MQTCSPSGRGGPCATGPVKTILSDVRNASARVLKVVDVRVHPALVLVVDVVDRHAPVVLYARVLTCRQRLVVVEP